MASRCRARRLLGAALAAAALACALPAAPAHAGRPQPPEDLFPRAARSYVVAIDGVVRWARAPDERRPVASLAKLLVALVLLERNWNADAVVTVSRRAARAGGSRLKLRAGERARAGELLAAMLVASSNDACAALVEHAAPDAAAFAARMNAKARALGMTSSHFVDPCGFDAPGQGSTATDLLRLAQAVIAVPQLAQVIAQPRGAVHTLGGRTLPYTASNLLLGRIDGARGVKTGRTAAAGNCLIGLATRGGTTVTVILLDAPDRWWTAAVLIDEAFRVSGSS